MVKVTLSFPLKKISRNSIGQLTRRPSFFVYFCLLLLFFFGLGLRFYRSLMLSWVSLYLPSQWTCSRFPNRKRYEIEDMLVCLFVCLFFFSMFFSNNINFAAFYAYHPTIPLIFICFILFSVMKICHKDVYKKRARFPSLQFPSSFSSLSCRIKRHSNNCWCP